MQRIASVCLALFFVTLGCGGSENKNSRQPSWRKAPAAAASSQHSAAPAEFIVLGASAATVSTYNSPVRVEVPTSELSDLVQEAVGQAASNMGQSAPVPDGRLYRALDELAAVAPLDSPLVYSLIEFALQRNGIIEPSPHLVIIEGSLDEPVAIVDQLRERLPSILSSGRFRRLGIGTARRHTSDLVLLAFQESNLATKAIIRELPAGGSTAIEGTLSAEFSAPHLFHTTEAGQVHSLSVASLGARGFRARFACEQHRGKQQIEITASDQSGSTVLANFPIWCGTKAPSSMRVASSKADPPPATREEAEERMLVLVNRDRAAHGLQPLSHDKRLTEIARRHSDEMLQTGQVAHVSATTGSAADRVKAGQVRTAVVLENVARAYGVAEAEMGLMNSPGHRANLLSKEVTDIGIGITLGEEVAGRRELLVTQVFIRVPKPIEPAAVRRQVAAKIQSTKAMTSSSALTVIAQAFADDLARGVSTKEASKRASTSLDKNAGGFARVSTLVTTVSAVSSFDPAGSLGDAQVRFYGLGIAQGTHDVMGDGAIFIVVLLAQR